MDSVLAAEEASTVRPMALCVGALVVRLHSFNQSWFTRVRLPLTMTTGRRCTTIPGGVQTTLFRS